MSFDLITKCITAFNTLKEKLVSAPIVVAPNWSLSLEIMCDASNHVIKAVLGQSHNKYFQPIYYASKTLTDAQKNYITTENELLAVIFAFEKFCPYLILSEVVVFIDHSALRYMFNKTDTKLRLFVGFCFCRNSTRRSRINKVPII